MPGYQSPSAVLALDRAGNPHSWITVENTIHLMAKNRVLAPLGEQSRVVQGGVNRVSCLRSSIEVSSILLTKAKVVPQL